MAILPSTRLYVLPGRDGSFGQTSRLLRLLSSVCPTRHLGRADAAAGKFDEMNRRALAEHKAGLTEEWP